ncbi:MAG: hypothetical protein C4518_01770 [Desulfobacteraceae bacterium]|nr:MAG: hypothetical protein C4518_01770 [Desulfobacteraceae bacterium]
MKIINEKTMRIAETGFIDSLREHLNWEAVKTSVKQQFDIDVHENVKYINGSLAVCRGEVAVRFDFDLEIKFSVFINREGDLVQITAPEGQELLEKNNPHLSVIPYLDEESRAAAAAAASDIAKMISKING